ncbi:hypothetical protein GCM10009739_23600 [Microbacterium ulmi]
MRDSPEGRVLRDLDPRLARRDRRDERTRGLYVTYDGQSNGDTFLDEASFPPADWEQSDVVFTGNGRASAELGGTVETILWDCTVLDPASSALIS